jgi:hypothetical protein
MWDYLEEYYIGKLVTNSRSVRKKPMFTLQYLAGICTLKYWPEVLTVLVLHYYTWFKEKIDTFGSHFKFLTKTSNIRIYVRLINYSKSKTNFIIRKIKIRILKNIFVQIFKRKFEYCSNC